MASTPSPSPEAAGGFTLEDVRVLPGPDLTLETYRHGTLGSRHLHLACADPVNVFMVGLPTPALDDTGLTHVLEHMVLCGGRRFPARRAFFAMHARSACLAMNASASDDCTGYHFATRNRQDFHNLLQVYLDCIFQPRLDAADFEAEGHRLEQAAGDGNPPVLRGVVLSEMQGAMSDPRVQLETALARHLFPGSAYRFNTGGDPECLPALTLARVREYHRRAYHPSNALFLSQGDIPASEHQRTIEAIALSGWPVGDAAGTAPPATEPTALAAPVAVSETYPARHGGAGGSQIAVAWLLGERRDPRAVLEARLLEALLLGPGPASLRPRLAAGDVAGRVSPASGLDVSRRRMSFCLALAEADARQAARFESAVCAGLERLVTAGIAGADVAAALDRVELAVRTVGSRRYPHGLELLARLLVPVLHGGDAARHLDLAPDLAALRRDALAPEYVASRIRALLLDNRHRVRLALEPGAASPRRRQGEHAAGSSGSGPHPPAALDDDALPELRVAQLDPSPPTPALDTEQHPGLRLQAARCRCGGVVHQTLAVSLPALDPDMADAAPLLMHCLVHRDGDREPIDAGDRLPATLPVRADWRDPGRARAALVLGGSALPAAQAGLARSLMGALDRLSPECPARLREVLLRARAGLASDALARGHEIAQWLAASASGGAAALRERWHGVSALEQLDRLLDDGDPSPLEAAHVRLQRLAARLRDCPRDGLVAADVVAYPACTGIAAGCWRGARETPATRAWEARPVIARGSALALQVASPVGHAARAFVAPPPDHRDAPALAVLGPLLGAGLLQERIRERGGAYGAGAGYCLHTGTFTLFSFRDPQPLETLAVFDAAVGWLRANLGRPQAVEHAKIAVVRVLDGSWSQAHAARQAFTEGVLGREPQRLLRFRKAVMAVTAADLDRACRDHLEGAPATTVVLAGGRALRDARARGMETRGRWL